jgi:uncharacterized membrane protein YdfJ with MMPL/SSD domain
MSGILYRLGIAFTRRKWLVLLAWAIVVAVVAVCVLGFGSRTSNDMSLPGSDAQRASDLLREHFPPQQNGTSPVVFHVARGRITDTANARAIRASLRRIARNAHVDSVISPFSRAVEGLTSRDGRTGAALVLFDVNSGQLDLRTAKRVFAGADAARKAGIQVEAGGSLGTRLSENESRRSEIIGVAAAIVILAFTFGAMVAVAMPIVTALVGLFVGLSLIGLLGHLLDIPDVAPTVATMMGLGVGIDYALFIVFRHRALLHDGVEIEPSVARTMATSGSAVVFAGGTVIIALLAILVAGIPLLGAMGYASAITVLVAVLTAVTLLPAMLALVGRRIDGLRLPGRRDAGQAPSRDSIWARWATVVTRHPWVALGASLIVLAPLMAPTLSLKLGQEDYGVTSTSTTQRRAFDLVSAGLGPGVNGPLLIAVKLQPPARPSLAYTRQMRAAKRLRRQLETRKQRLTQKAAALTRIARGLKASETGLRAQGLALGTQRSALLARGAVLQREKARLLAEKDRLASEKARLTASSQALTVQGQALAAQIAQIQQQLATTTDPAEIARLQAELAVLAGEAAEVQKRAASLQKEGALLAREAASLKADGQALRLKAGGLRSQGAGLQAQASQLTAEGDVLKSRAETLKEQGARLKREKRRLVRRARRATALRDSLTELLTKAGGQALATDPRVVALQDALERAAGVTVVSSPQVNDSGSAVVLSVTSTTRPADQKTADLVQRLRDQVIPSATRADGTTVYVGGATAAYADLAGLITKRLPLVIAVVLALSFLLLLVAFRSVFVPISAVICNLLAVVASFGVLTVIFQWGWGLSLVGLSNPYGTVPIASYVPLLMFAGLFGLSMDYEVFLVSQIFQARSAGKPPIEAVRSGVTTSARVITAAALIMITVFASFVLNEDPIIKQFGVGLSIAIVLDATLVRIVIVPASMAILGKWNWYLPKWLAWLPRIDVPEDRKRPAEVEAAPAGARATGDEATG